ncbi:MAG: hypothetical protein ICV87_10255 [Gemmatimonadetes bacterium]|nr:hypothetical protein [Gemmatimonadota bacterium]
MKIRSVACAVVLAAAACGTEPPGPATDIEAISRAPAPVTILTAAPDSVAVKVVDDEGRGVRNVEVQWSGDGVEVSAPTSLTDRNGKAAVAWRSGRTTGSPGITASVATSDGTRSVAIPVAVVSPMSVRFDGIDDYVQVPNSATLAAGTGNFAWEIWLKRGRTGIREDVMTKKNVFADSERDVAFVVEGDGRVSAFLRDSPFRSTVIVESVSSIGTDWAHVVMSRNGGVVSLYVNGRLEGERSAPFDVTSSGPLRIGANRLNNAGPDAPVAFPFSGLVHEVRVWNRALLAPDVAAAAMGCVPRRTQGVVADLRFDEGSGTAVRDASVN